MVPDDVELLAAVALLLNTEAGRIADELSLEAVAVMTRVHGLLVRAEELAVSGELGDQDRELIAWLFEDLTRLSALIGGGTA